MSTLTPATNPRNSRQGRQAPKMTSAGTALIRLSIGLAIILGAVLGFWASATNENFEVPSIDYRIRVESFASSASNDEVLHHLEQIANDHDGDIIVEIPRNDHRDAFGAGSHVEKWINSGYRPLPGTQNVVFHSLSSLPHQDYRQVLEINGSPSLRNAVTSYLDSQGIKHEQLVSQRWSFILVGTALGDVAKTLLTAALLLGAVGTALNYRRDAIRQLHGHGYFRSLISELSATSNVTLTILLLSATLAIFGLALIANPLSALQVGYFAAIFVMAGIASTIFAIACALCVNRMRPIVPVIKGELPRGTVLLGSAALRIGVCIIAVTMLIGLINYTSEWHKQNQESQVWSSLPEATAVTLSGARSTEDLDSTTKSVAVKLRQISARGDLYYAQYLDQPLVAHLGVSRDVMVFNSSAAQHSLPSDILERIRPLKEEAILLSPRTSHSGDSNEATNDELQHMIAPDTSFTEISYTSDISVPTWEVGEDEWINRAYAENPVVVVLPDSHLGLSDRNLVAALSQKDLTFARNSDVDQLSHDKEVGSFFRAATPLSTLWHSHHSRMGNTVWAYAGGFLLALLLCAISALALFQAFTKVYHQNIRVALIIGRLSKKVLSMTFFIEAVTLVSILYFLWNRGAQAREWTSGGRMSGAADPSLIAMFSVPTSAWFVGIFLIVATSLPAFSVLTTLVRDSRKNPRNSMFRSKR